MGGTIKRFEAADAAAPPPKGAVLLIGGSNARRWTNVADYFPRHRVINRCFGCAWLTGVLHYIGRIVLPCAPETILLNAGGNTLRGRPGSKRVKLASCLSPRDFWLYFCWRALFRVEQSPLFDSRKTRW
ncbi:MAG: hypothetical protein JNL98_28310 [Bryobacterales bacterium]|nr:hypothetical protein [Bryobacterales bacterium]